MTIKGLFSYSLLKLPSDTTDTSNNNKSIRNFGLTFFTKELDISNQLFVNNLLEIRVFWTLLTNLKQEITRYNRLILRMLNFDIFGSNGFNKLSSSNSEKDSETSVDSNVGIIFQD